MGQASNRKWMKRAWAYLYEIGRAKKKGEPRPDKSYEHRKFWRAFINITEQ